jgi:hypothetical protein
MDDNQLLLAFQQQYINQLLHISLNYDNVLYCMNNETNEDAAWGLYWLAYIQERAAAADKTIMATDMFDGAWTEGVVAACRQQFGDDRYAFIDVSQVNAWRCTIEQHWANLRDLRQLNAQNPRPLNNVKIYGADGLADYAGPGNPRCSDLDGVTSFWMNLLGGCASVRFHRPPHGLHLSPLAQANIRSARLLEQRLCFWDLRADDEIYTTTNGGRAFCARSAHALVLFLPAGGCVTLPYAGSADATVTCLNVRNAECSAPVPVDMQGNN